MTPLGWESLNRPTVPVGESDGTVVVYGASDDGVVVEGKIAGCDEYEGSDVTLMLVGEALQVRLRVRFERGGVWSIAVSQAAEGMDALPVSIDGGVSGYSVRATVSGVRLVTREQS